MGNLVSVIDPLGKVASRNYDILSRPIASVDAKGNTTTTVYDNLNRVISIINAEGVTTEFEYNLLGQTISQTLDPIGLNQVTNFAYDTLNRMVSVTKANGVIELAEYDLVDRKVKNIEDPAGLNIITQYEFNQLGQTTKIIDAENKETHYTYNLLGQLTTETYADNNSKAYTYNKLGQRTTHTDANQNHFVYEFDNLHRVTEVNITTGTGVVGTTQQTFEYDLMSRIIKTKDISPTGVNEVEHQYNTLSRLLSENLKIGDSSPTTVTKEYTKVGRVSKLIYPSGRVNTYTYDDNYLPQTISSNGEIVASYEFNTINAPTKKTLGNQVTLEIEYNTRQQATKHIWKKNGNIISGYYYGYDSVGNRIWSENQVEADKSEHFTFDSADRLTGYQKGILNANQTGTVSPTYFQNWNLDNIGNWKLFDDNGVSSTNQFNQVHAMTEFKGTTQTFDANGNLISDGVRSFIYDAFNRLLEVKIGNTIIAQYQYDTYNRRVSKTTNAGTTHYLYDGFRCIEEQNENGILEKEYIHGSLYIDEIISQISNAETYYFTHDYRYSVTSLTDTSGNTVTTYDYKVYGNREGNTTLTDIGYTGQRHDSETGLMYFRNRYYNPITGSFITKDPLGYVDGMSMYLGYFGKQGMDWKGLEVTIVVDYSKANEKNEDGSTFLDSMEKMKQEWNKRIDRAIGFLDDPRNVKEVKFIFNGVEKDKEFIRRELQNSKVGEIYVLPQATAENYYSEGINRFNEILKELRDAQNKTPGRKDYVLFETHTMQDNTNYEGIEFGGFVKYVFDKKTNELHPQFKGLIDGSRIEITIGSCFFSQKKIDNLGKDWKTIVAGNSGASHTVLHTRDIWSKAGGTAKKDENIGKTVLTKITKVAIDLKPLTKQNEFVSKPE